MLLFLLKIASLKRSGEKRAVKEPPTKVLRVKKHEAF
jgi:hypothetical protein